MALGDIGKFNQMTDEAIRAESIKTATYLSQMDQFYAELDETIRQFNETLGYKESVLAEQKWEAGETFRLQGEELALEEKLGTEELALRERIAEDEASYRAEMLRLREKEVDIQDQPYVMSLGMTAEARERKEGMDLIKQFLTRGEGGEAVTMRSGEVSVAEEEPSSPYVFPKEETSNPYLDTTVLW